MHYRQLRESGKPLVSPKIVYQWVILTFASGFFNNLLIMQVNGVFSARLTFIHNVYARS
ncbi:hypothetical protein RHECNPAF_13600112 [Rhizobium etli CNPAF512]|nr:hypothetical protein RHECNPAF_13600112 [Rhizobium etli CNPAF512]